MNYKVCNDIFGTVVLVKTQCVFLISQLVLHMFQRGISKARKRLMHAYIIQVQSYIMFDPIADNNNLITPAHCKTSQRS